LHRGMVINEGSIPFPRLHSDYQFVARQHIRYSEYKSEFVLWFAPMSADAFFIDATDLLGPEQSDKVAAINRRSVGSSAKWRNYSS
jgi:hypothetical protein